MLGQLNIQALIALHNVYTVHSAKGPITSSPLDRHTRTDDKPYVHSHKN